LVSFRQTPLTRSTIAARTASGRAQQVFTYRLIDTVEEKVLKLQKTKKDLAAAIIGADNSLIKNLRREDLELLRRRSGPCGQPALLCRTSPAIW
jgi:hypothetical protein